MIWYLSTKGGDILISSSNCICYCFLCYIICNYAFVLLYIFWKTLHSICGFCVQYCKFIFIFADEDSMRQTSDSNVNNNINLINNNIVGNRSSSSSQVSSFIIFYWYNQYFFSLHFYLASFVYCDSRLLNLSTNLSSLNVLNKNY